MRRYIITGAGGHLGRTLLQLLSGQDCEVFALVLPGTPEPPLPGVRYIRGDVLEPDSLLPLFEGCEPSERFVIHAAGLISISRTPSPELFQVNVEGTRNVLSLCSRLGIGGLVYVSSVHAISAPGPGLAILEPASFSPDHVEGAYAKTKAQASQLVLEAAARGLPARVVLPSGILGPGDGGSNHLVQMLSDYLQGKLRYCIRGGYNFVDVRDVAFGCIRALQKGRPGECYLLTGKHCEIQDLLAYAGKLADLPAPRRIPLPLARLWAEREVQKAEQQGRRPLCTPYSLSVLQSNDHFLHDKAARDLAFLPRNLHETVADTVNFLLHSKESQ